MYLVHLEQDPRKRNSVEDQSQDDLADFRPCAEQQIWRGVILCTLPHSLPNLFKNRELEKTIVLDVLTVVSVSESE